MSVSVSEQGSRVQPVGVAPQQHTIAVGGLAFDWVMMSLACSSSVVSIWMAGRIIMAGSMIRFSLSGTPFSIAALAWWRCC